MSIEYRPAGGTPALNTVENISQAGHGFVVGQVLRPTLVDNVFALAQANTTFNAEVVGIVTQVVDANNFVMTTHGEVTVGVPALPASTVMFLSDTVAGALTNIEPIAVGTVSKPVMVIEANAARAKFINYRGKINNTPLPITFYPMQFVTSANLFSQTFGQTLYVGHNGFTLDTTESNEQSQLYTGQFTDMSINVITNTLDAATTLMLRLNGGVSTLTLSIPAGATGYFTFASSVAVSGDLTNYEVDTSASTLGIIEFTKIISRFETA